MSKHTTKWSVSHHSFRCLITALVHLSQPFTTKTVLEKKTYFEKSYFDLIYVLLENVWKHQYFYCSSYLTTQIHGQNIHPSPREHNCNMFGSVYLAKWHGSYRSFFYYGAVINIVDFSIIFLQRLNIFSVSWISSIWIIVKVHCRFDMLGREQTQTSLIR